MKLRKTRIRAYLITTAWLAVIWVLLWGQLTWANVLGGIVVAIVVTLAFPLPGMDFTGHPRILPLISFIFHMTVDLVISSIAVAYRGVVHGPSTKSAVIKVKLHCRNDLYLTWIAESLSLIPGSLIIEARRATSELYVHVLGVKSQADLDRQRARIYQLEDRVMRAVASKAELAAYHESRAADLHTRRVDS